MLSAIKTNLKYVVVRNKSSARLFTFNKHQARAFTNKIVCSTKSSKPQQQTWKQILAPQQQIEHSKLSPVCVAQTHNYTPLLRPILSPPPVNSHQFIYTFCYYLLLLLFLWFILVRMQATTYYHRRCSTIIVARK